MASAELNMSLDDIIKQRKQTNRGVSRGRARGISSSRGAGPIRRNVARGSFRATPYGSIKANPVAADGTWQHDLFSKPGVPGGIETGTKLYISNLEFGVSNEDVKELFGEVGELKRSSVNYDRSGRSKGTAEVVFARRTDALAAIQRYNNVQLDGKPMKIELIGTSMAAPTPVVPAVARLGPSPVAMKQRGAIRGRGVFRGGRGAGRGRGRGRGSQKIEKTQEELDAELDLYHAKKDKPEEMQT